MTKQIRALAPKDATHFRTSSRGVTYFKFTPYGAMIYLNGLGWVTSASNKKGMQRLHKPKWLEPLVVVAVILVSLFVILG